MAHGRKLLLLALGLSLLAVAAADDVAGLADFYNRQSANGKALLTGLGWNTKTDPCTWGAKSGVGCDGGLTVSSINLDCTGKGKLGGRLSPKLTMYTSVRLFAIKNCALIGRIPNSFTDAGAFPVLELLDLSRNKLSGAIPVNLGQKKSMDSVRAIYLNNNRFTGNLDSLDVWSKAGRMVNLQRLNLANNPIAGKLPDSWGKSNAAWPASIRINLCGTNVKGPVPTAWTGCCIRIYTTPDPMGICGKLPPSFADAGTDAGLFRCGLWDGGEPGQKYPNNLVMCAP